MYFKKTLVLFSIIFASLINTYYDASANINILASTLNAESGKKTILIDPGHGGIDGGAVSKRGTLEKDINLSISLKFRDKLAESGFNVIMTRESDIGLYTSEHPVRKSKQEDLHKRCNMKGDSNCDLFISIHQNFFPEDKYYGAQVWYCKPVESKVLAETIQKNFRSDLDINNKREEKHAGNLYRILKCHCEIPSVIVECGFLSNGKEDSLLRDENYQQKIADSLCKSVIEFFQNEINQDNNNPNS